MSKSTLGKWSVGLNALFLVGVIVSIILVLGLGILDFGDRWWDVTVPILAGATIIALILGIMAVRKKDNSMLVYLSIAVSVCAILFALLHSLFIND